MNDKKKKEDNQTVEELFNSLKIQVDLLEDQQSDIENSFLAYENSMEIIEEINKKISFYKGKLKILNEKNKFNEFNSDLER